MPRPAREYTGSTEWIQDGACRSFPSEVFFPDGTKREAVNAAKTICGVCVVQTPCLEYALNNRIDHGIWGGTDEAERRRHLKIRRASSL